jgi:hypothetical protein
MNELTLEDQLVADLVSHFRAYPPAAIAIRDFRATGERPLPCVIIGHEGCEYEKGKGMSGTGRVALRLAVVSDLDATDPTHHRTHTAAIDLAVRELGPQTLALTYVHVVYQEAPANEIDDRRQTTVLAYTVIATRCNKS